MALPSRVTPCTGIKVSTEFSSAYLSMFPPARSPGILPYSSTQQQQQPSYLNPSSPPCTFDVRLNSLALLLARYSSLITHTSSHSPSPHPTIKPTLLDAWRGALATQFSLLQQRHMLVRRAKRVGGGKAVRFGKRGGGFGASGGEPGASTAGSAGVSAGDGGVVGGGVSGSTGGAMMGGDMVMGGEASMPGFEGTAADSGSSMGSTSGGDAAVTPERGLQERMMMVAEEGGAGLPVVGEQGRRSAAEVLTSSAASSAGGASASSSSSAAAGDSASEPSVPLSREATLPIGHMHTFIGSKPLDAAAAVPVATAASSAAASASSVAAVATLAGSFSSRIGSVDAAAVTRPMDAATEMGPEALSGAVESMPAAGVTSGAAGVGLDAGGGADGEAPASRLLLPYFSWDDVPYLMLALTPSGGEGLSEEGVGVWVLGWESGRE